MQRIGVFVCHCGTNIAATVDVKAVAEALSHEPGVVISQDYQYMCSESGQNLIKDAIKEHSLTGVVVCSCSPRMHENTFRQAAERAGINPYMVEIANIREHCSWIHKDMEEATEKAVILARAAIAKVNLNAPLKPGESRVTKRALIIGGGIAGIQTALDIADAGYESEENYVFLDKNQQLAFIKPANYEISKTRKYKNDIGRMENMDYDGASDTYTCRNGKQLSFAYVRRSKSKTGYVSEKSIYHCSECKDCPYKKDCIKGNHCKTPMEERNKMLSVAKTFLDYRKEDLGRIVSEEGILLRTNRSIQAEGSFGELKQDMQFRRYLSRGTSNVLAESVLLAMARNINKLHTKIQKGKTGIHLFPLRSA